MSFSNGFSTVVLLLLMGTVGIATSAKSISIYPHELSKLSFTEISKCSGMYDKGIYAEMNGICFDCYRQFRDPGVYRECRYVFIKNSKAY